MRNNPNQSLRASFPTWNGNKQLISLLEKNEIPKICFLSLALTPILIVTAEIFGMSSSNTWGFSAFPGSSQLSSSSFRMWHLCTSWKGTAQSAISRAVTLDVSQWLQMQYIFPGCVFPYHTSACSGFAFPRSQHKPCSYLQAVLAIPHGAAVPGTPWLPLYEGKECPSPCWAVVLVVQDLP